MFCRLFAALLIVAGLCGHGSFAQTGDPAAPGAARESVAATKYLQVVDHYLFVALWGRGVQVLDISDPTRPKWVGGWNPRRCQEGIHVSGGRAYIADRLAGLTVLDVSNPTQPAQIGNVDTPGDAFAVDVGASALMWPTVRADCRLWTSRIRPVRRYWATAPFLSGRPSRGLHGRPACRSWGITRGWHQPAGCLPWMCVIRTIP